MRLSLSTGIATATDGRPGYDLGSSPEEAPLPYPFAFWIIVQIFSGVAGMSTQAMP